LGWEVRQRVGTTAERFAYADKCRFRGVSPVHELSQCRNRDTTAVAWRILTYCPQDSFADARLYRVGTHCESRRRVNLAAQRLAGPLERALPPLNGDGNSLQ
jgi:hypothetical protein